MIPCRWVSYGELNNGILFHEKHVSRSFGDRRHGTSHLLHLLGTKWYTELYHYGTLWNGTSCKLNLLKIVMKLRQLGNDYWSTNIISNCNPRYMCRLSFIFPLMVN